MTEPTPLDRFIARIGDEAQAREGVAESRMSSRDLSIARAAYRAGAKAGIVATTEAAAQMAESWGGHVHFNALRSYDHLETYDD